MSRAELSAAVFLLRECKATDEQVDAIMDALERLR